MTLPDPRRQRAYHLYVEDKLPLKAVARILHVDNLKTRAWIVELGGTIRKHGYNRFHGNKAVQVGPGKRHWLKHVVCVIGPVREGEAVGAMFCANICALTYYEGKCDEETSEQDLAAFAKFKAEREADEKLRKERKAKKPSGAFSGGALWRG